MYQDTSALKTQSLFRRLQYKELSKCEINGKILDLGGSRFSGYHELIKGGHSFDVANIKREEGVDLIFDAQEEFPLDDERYDGIICLNVLEHLFGYQNAVNESYRVLKKGGVMIGAVPFMFNVHGSPDDYFRYTKSALIKIFEESGFHDIKIKELGSGAFSVTYHALFGLYRFGFIKEFFMKFAALMDKLLLYIKKENAMTEKNMPLGYFFILNK